MTYAECCSLQSLGRLIPGCRHAGKNIAMGPNDGESIIPTHLDAQDHLASYFLDLSINRMLAEAVCRGPEEPISIRISSDKHCNLQWHCQETVSWLHVAALNSIAEQWFCTPDCPVRSHQAQRRWIQSQFATDWKERCLHEEAVHLW